MIHGPCNAGSCVAACRLEEYLVFGEIWELFTHQGRMLFVGDDYYMFFWHEGEDPVKTHLKKASPCPEKIYELFRA